MEGIAVNGILSFSICISQVCAGINLCLFTFSRISGRRVPVLHFPAHRHHRNIDADSVQTACHRVSVQVMGRPVFNSVYHYVTGSIQTAVRKGDSCSTVNCRNVDAKALPAAYQGNIVIPCILFDRKGIIRGNSNIAGPLFRSADRRIFNRHSYTAVGIAYTDGAVYTGADTGSAKAVHLIIIRHIIFGRNGNGRTSVIRKLNRILFQDRFHIALILNYINIQAYVGPDAADINNGGQRMDACVMVRGNGNIA